MEYIAYILIVLALLIELRDSVKGGKDSVPKETKLRMLSTFLFLAGAITYTFTEHLHLMLALFIGMTVISSWMLGISTAVYVEEDHEGISSELKRKRERE